MKKLGLYLYANSEDADQLPSSMENAASDPLVLYCLLSSSLWDARHEWVNGQVRAINEPPHDKPSK